MADSATEDTERTMAEFEALKKEYLSADAVWSKMRKKLIKDTDPIEREATRQKWKKAKAVFKAAEERVAKINAERETAAGIPTIPMVQPEVIPFKVADTEDVPINPAVSQPGQQSLSSTPTVNDTIPTAQAAASFLETANSAAVPTDPAASQPKQQAPPSVPKINDKSVKGKTLSQTASAMTGSEVVPSAPPESANGNDETNNSGRTTAAGGHLTTLKNGDQRIPTDEGSFQCDGAQSDNDPTGNNPTNDPTGDNDSKSTSPEEEEDESSSSDEEADGDTDEEADGDTDEEAHESSSSDEDDEVVNIDRQQETPAPPDEDDKMEICDGQEGKTEISTANARENIDRQQEAPAPRQLNYMQNPMQIDREPGTIDPTSHDPSPNYMLAGNQQGSTAPAVHNESSNSMSIDPPPGVAAPEDQDGSLKDHPEHETTIIEKKPVGTNDPKEMTASGDEESLSRAMEVDYQREIDGSGGQNWLSNMPMTTNQQATILPNQRKRPNEVEADRNPKTPKLEMQSTSILERSDLYVFPDNFMNGAQPYSASNEAAPSEDGAYNYTLPPEFMNMQQAGNAAPSEQPGVGFPFMNGFAFGDQIPLTNAGAGSVGGAGFDVGGPMNLQPGLQVDWFHSPTPAAPNYALTPISGNDDGLCRPTDVPEQKAGLPGNNVDLGPQAVPIDASEQKAGTDAGQPAKPKRDIGLDPLKCLGEMMVKAIGKNIIEQVHQRQIARLASMEMIAQKEFELCSPKQRTMTEIRTAISEIDKEIAILQSNETSLQELWQQIDNVQRTKEAKEREKPLAQRRKILQERLAVLNVQLRKGPRGEKLRILDEITEVEAEMEEVEVAIKQNRQQEQQGRKNASKAKEKSKAKPKKTPKVPQAVKEKKSKAQLKEEKEAARAAACARLQARLEAVEAGDVEDELDKPLGAEEDDRVVYSEYAVMTREFKTEIINEARDAIAAFMKSGKLADLKPRARKTVTMLQGLLPAESLASKELVIALHTNTTMNIVCRYHRDHQKVKQFDACGQYLVEGVAYLPKYKQKIEDKIEPPEGYAHCGCPIDDILIDFWFWKTWTAAPRRRSLVDLGLEESLKTDALPPRFRAFIIDMFKSWTQLTSDDLYAKGGSGQFTMETDIRLTSIRKLVDYYRKLTGTPIFVGGPASLLQVEDESK